MKKQIVKLTIWLNQSSAMFNNATYLNILLAWLSSKQHIRQQELPQSILQANHGRDGDARHKSSEVLLLLYQHPRHEVHQSSGLLFSRDTPRILNALLKGCVFGR